MKRWVIVRKLVFFCNLLSILMYPVLFAVGWLTIWFTVHHSGLVSPQMLAYLPDSTHPVLTDRDINGFSLFHAIIATAILGMIVRKFYVVQRACVREDPETVINWMIGSLHPLMHTILAVLTINIMIGIVGPRYDNDVLALYSITGWSMVLGLYWAIATELDDPLNGRWIVRNAEWGRRVWQEWKTNQEKKEQQAKAA
jgi:hypothetical protein